MKKEIIYQKQYKLSLMEFFSGLPKFISMLVSAFLSNSLLVWLDATDILINTANIGFVTIISKKLTKNLKYEYNYGIEKIEALSALLIATFEFFGVMIIFGLSVAEIFSPKQPSGLLLLPIIFKVLNIVHDITILVQQKKIMSYENTKIIQIGYATCVKDAMFDLITFISIFVCWAFRKYHIVWYFSPVMCCIISLYVVYHSVSGIRKAISELTEKTLPEDEQLKILKCLSEFYSEYSELISVNSLVRGNINYIELHLKFAPDTTFEQIDSFKQRFSDSLKDKMGDCKIKIVV